MKRKTIWVKYKNIDGKYDIESKVPQKIWEDKFNTEFHRKLLLKNTFQFFYDILNNLNKNGKTDWKWVLGIFLGLPSALYGIIKIIEFLNK